MYRLTRAETEGDETLYQRGWSSQTELSPLLSLPNDEMVRKYSFEKNSSTKLSNKKEWKGELPTYFLKRDTIKWYADGSNTDKGTSRAVFGPGNQILRVNGVIP
ncbi:hypothetical protein Trydic_g21178 [Trypoxylus dichotomus]